MKNHYGSLKHKPKIIPSIASSRENVLDKDGKPVDGSFLSYTNANGQKMKEVAKQKLAKITAYQKSINELYMPKQSEKKKNEMEKIKNSLKTEIRERQPI